MTIYFLTGEEEEAKFIAKRIMLGNIKFIGELGKLEMLHDSTIHKCCEHVSIHAFNFVMLANRNRITKLSDCLIKFIFWKAFLEIILVLKVRLEEFVMEQVTNKSFFKQQA